MSMSWSDKYEPPEEREYFEMIANSGKGRIRGWLTGPVLVTVALAVAGVLMLAIFGVVVLL